MKFAIRRLDNPLFLLPAHNTFMPFCVILFLYIWQRPGNEFLDITDTALVNHDVLVDFAAVYVDLYDLCPLCKFIWIQCDSVAESSAKCDDQISLVDGSVGGYAAMHADQTQVKVTVVSYNACCHQSIGGWNVRLLQQCSQFLTGVRCYDASSDISDRLLCSINQLNDCRDVVSLHDGAWFQF